MNLLLAEFILLNPAFRLSLKNIYYYILMKAVSSSLVNAHKMCHRDLCFRHPMHLQANFNFQIKIARYDTIC